MLTVQNIYQICVHQQMLWIQKETKQSLMFDFTKPCFPLNTESLSFSDLHSGDKMLLKCFMASLALKPPCWNEEWEPSGHLAGVHLSSQFKSHFSLCRRDRVKDKQESCFYFLIKEGRSCWWFGCRNWGEIPFLCVFLSG